MAVRGKCWIIGRRNGVGLEQDAALLSRALTAAGWTVEAHAPRDWKVLLNPGKKADVIIHLERVFPVWKLKKAVHFLIPNQERYPVRQVGRLKKVDHILCKSRHAEEIFSRLHPSVHFTGFTSPDRVLGESSPDYGRFFHLAGKSTLKNTEVLLELWSRHPEWPPLTLVQHPSNAPATVPPNVELLSGYLDADELRALQNSRGIHLCPSLSEGWGHYIVEAMSCHAVTVTTDAPPMNELVQRDHGIVVPYHQDEPRHLGRNYKVDPALLEEAIIALIAAPAEEKRALGNAARKWFLRNDENFNRILPERVGKLVGTRP
ncbi:MAG: glycosyltransferase [Verrucomicrobiaceae bacterium]|nr:MAG: glycosyltransferase [Verrucomicrobiaceae bacterium]